jgi:hypothetical protein
MSNMYGRPTWRHYNPLENEKNLEHEHWERLAARLIAVKIGLPITTAATVADLAGFQCRAAA